MNAFFKGDPTLLESVYSHADDVTYLPAEGGLKVDWDAVYADWKLQAEKSMGGSVAISDVHIVVGEDMAIAQNITTGHVKGTDGKNVQTTLRESSAFRKENGEWRMITHHCDAFKLWEDIVNR